MNRFLLIFLLFAGCQFQKETVPIVSKVYGGMPSVVGDWSGVVSLEKNGKNFCTGTIISSTTVLAAAHCVRSYDFSLEEVTIKSEVGEYSLENATIHPRYHGGPFDFSLLQIQGEFLEESVMEFPHKWEWGYLVRAGRPVVLVGYGKRENAESGVKYQVDVDILELRNFDFIAGGEGKSSCHGDSGGPVFAKGFLGQWKIIGVVHGKKDPTKDCGNETVYGDARWAQEWLLEKNHSY